MFDVVLRNSLKHIHINKLLSYYGHFIITFS